LLDRLAYAASGTARALDKRLRKRCEHHRSASSRICPGMTPFPGGTGVLKPLTLDHDALDATVMERIVAGCASGQCEAAATLPW
jgi:hypothetical protein